MDRQPLIICIAQAQKYCTWETQNKKISRILFRYIMWQLKTFFILSSFKEIKLETHFRSQISSAWYDWISKFTCFYVLSFSCSHYFACELSCFSLAANNFEE